jgi:hypothetical protein
VGEQTARRMVPNIVAGAAAAVLTAAAVLYTPIAVASSAQGSAMAVRTRFLLAVLVLSAISTWLLAIRPTGLVARSLSSFTNGFNLIWIVSFVGPPVVVASLLAVAVATMTGSRRLILRLTVLVVGGLGLGVLLLFLTEPPGEHLFN